MYLTVICQLRNHKKKSYPCSVCGTGVGNTSAIQCKECKKWVHRRCSGLMKKNLEMYASTYKCRKCDRLETQTDSEQFMHDENAIIGFENIGTSNNCWLNCIMQILLQTEFFFHSNPEGVELIPLQGSPRTRPSPFHRMFKDFIDDIVRLPRLCNLSRPYVDHPVAAGFVSLKDVFSEVVENPDFKSNRQQDAANALQMLLSNHEHFDYFCYKYKYINTCSQCRKISATPSNPDYILKIAVKQEGEK